MTCMTLQQITYFLAVVTERNFTKAAHSCGVRQSTLSLAIKELEWSLGVRLFERSPRRTDLTPAGRALRPAFASIARKFDRVKKEAAKFRSYKEQGTHKSQLAFEEQNGKSAPLI